MTVIGSDGLRVGFVPLFEAARESPADYVAELESLGIDSLWAPGHIAGGRPLPEAITGLARLAVLSERALVGTAVLLAPLYHPVIAAKQFAELDRMTGGRVAVGVGVGGEYEMEFAACQANVRDRGARCDEAIGIMRRLWAGERVDNPGPFWPFEGVALDPLPARGGGPPIIVAGRAEPPMRRAALRGDGWFPFLYSAGRYASSVETITGIAAAAGRDLAGFDWLCFVYVSIAGDAAVARARAVEFIGGGQAGDGSRFAALIDRVAVVGDTDDVRQGLQAFVDAGVRHLVLLPCDRDDPVAVARLIMREIVPGLRT